MSIAISRPDPLPTDRYVTLSERRAHTAQMAAWEASLREPETPPVKPQRNKPSVHTLSDDEYDALRRKEWEENQRRQRERDEAAQAAAKARQEFLASEPETVTVSASDPYSFLLDYQHRVLQGYRLPDDGMGLFNIGFYSVTMRKPATQAPAKKR